MFLLVVSLLLHSASGKTTLGAVLARLIALHRGHEVAVQVKTGDPPLRLPATALRRMQDEAKHLGWIPLLAAVGREVRFFEIAGVNAGRERTRTVPFDTPVEDILSLL